MKVPAVDDPYKRPQAKLCDWPEGWDGLWGYHMAMKAKVPKEKEPMSIMNAGACTAGYLNNIYGTPVEDIKRLLNEHPGSYSFIFAITGANNVPYKTDEHLVKVGFKEVFQAPNFLHNNVPIKLWAIDMKQWLKEEEAKHGKASTKQPRVSPS